ncbi:hypothetical protein GCM10023165_31130 [Variovorax defluvii]|uniref:Uncharacterized protein n=1 Tax=Variovorax defluvii TaxID=913761 RepID=A0ABP8HX11_9BURK
MPIEPSVMPTLLICLFWACAAQAPSSEPNTARASMDLRMKSLLGGLLRWKRFRGTPRNRLCRAAGVAPGEGVGGATRSAHSLGESNILRGTGFAGPLVLPPERGLAERHEVRTAWGRTQVLAEPLRR